MRYALILATLLSASGLLAQTPEVLQQRISREGAATVVRQLNESGEWQTVMRRIGRGKSEWLRLAEVLLPGTDAGATSELNDAVGEALVFAPTRVLALPTTLFATATICGGPDVDDPRFDSADLAGREIDRRVASVATLPRSARVHECLAALRQAREGIRRFYSP